MAGQNDPAANDPPTANALSQLSRAVDEANNAATTAKSAAADATRYKNSAETLAKTLKDSVEQIADKISKLSGIVPETTLARKVIRWIKQIFEVPNLIQTALLICIGVQLYFLADQIKLTREQLALTERATVLTERTTALAVLRQIREDANKVGSALYASEVYQDIRKAPCGTPFDPTAPRIAHAFKPLLDHYEIYFEAAALKMIPADLWKSLCRETKEFPVTNCHVSHVWNKYLETADPHIASAYRSCEMP